MVGRRDKSGNANEMRKASGVQLVTLLLGQPEAISAAGCETSSLNAGGDVRTREQAHSKCCSPVLIFLFEELV